MANRIEASSWFSSTTPRFYVTWDSGIVITQIINHKQTNRGYFLEKQKEESESLNFYSEDTSNL